MQGPLGEPSLPKCRDCGGGSPNVVSHTVLVGPYRTPEVRHEWVCAACEYKAAFPHVAPVPLLPRERKPLRPQVETLPFDAA